MGFAHAVNSIGRTIDRETRRQWDIKDREKAQTEMAQYDGLRQNGGRLLEEAMRPQDEGIEYSGFGEDFQPSDLNLPVSVVDAALRDDLLNRKYQLEQDTMAYDKEYGHYTPDEWAKVDFSQAENPQALWRSMSKGVKQYADTTRYREQAQGNDDAQALRLYETLQGHLGDAWVAHQQGNEQLSQAHFKKLIDTVPMPYRYLGNTEDGRMRIGMYEEGQLKGEEALTTEQLYNKLKEWSGPEFVRHVRAFNKFKSEYNLKSAQKPSYFHKDGQLVSVSGFMDDSGNHFAMVWSDDKTMRPVNMEKMQADGWQPIMLGKGGSRGGTGRPASPKTIEAQQVATENKIFATARSKPQPTSAVPNPPNKPRVNFLDYGQDGGLIGSFVDRVGVDELKRIAAAEGMEITFSPVERDPRGFLSKKNRRHTAWEITGVFGQGSSQGAQTGAGLYAGINSRPQAPSQSTPQGSPDFHALEKELVDEAQGGGNGGAPGRHLPQLEKGLNRIMGVAPEGTPQGERTERDKHFDQYYQGLDPSAGYVLGETPFKVVEPSKRNKQQGPYRTPCS